MKGHLYKFKPARSLDEKVFSPTITKELKKLHLTQENQLPFNKSSGIKKGFLKNLHYLQEQIARGRLWLLRL